MHLILDTFAQCVMQELRRETKTECITATLMLFYSAYRLPQTANLCEIVFLHGVIKRKHVFARIPPEEIKGLKMFIWKRYLGYAKRGPGEGFGRQIFIKFC